MAAQTDHPVRRSASSMAQDELVNQPKKQKTAKKKVLPPAVQLRARIHQAAKHVDQHDDAFAAFEEARLAGIKLSPDCLVTLLFLAAGGDQWETFVYNDEKRNEYMRTMRLDKCDEILASLQEVTSSGTPLVEMCYTALARKEAILGNGEAALKHALSIPDAQQRKNRCFLPALAAFGKSGNAVRALETYENLMQAGLLPGEPEFAKVLDAISKDTSGNVAWSTVESVLQHMARETTELEMSTIRVLQALFDSWAGFKTSSSFCKVLDDGYCKCCDNRLQAIDLDTDEYTQFSLGIASLAKKHGKRAEEFDEFLKWLDDHGPFGVIIDAANVAFYNQNFDSGGFNFAQIESVVERIGVEYPDLKPLVILHVNRTRGPAASAPKAKALLKTLVEQNRFYAAPMGSNDDWYWMYAAVIAGTRGILVSNDEMRDHLFSLLAPKYFKKWKQRHQMRYTFSGEPKTLSFDNPPPFTRCTQMLRKENGETSWMFPVGNDSSVEGNVQSMANNDKEWLCCSIR